MNALAQILTRRIQTSGPISLADYMAECLLHPEYGYYTSQVPFGKDGDFITAPEISQMFGEMLGLCLAQYWLDLGQPTPFSLSEIGPGRGTLMADVLRATRGVPGFQQAAQIFLIEASPQLRQTQQRALAGYDVTWLEHIDQLPHQPLFLLANEFFDALPIRQFQKTEQAWDETMVGLGPDNTLQFGRVLRPDLKLRDDAKLGDVVEICPAAPAIMAQISERISTHQGLALIIDYGGWNGVGDTFQAMQNHAYTDALARPGQADLTAHVDFAALAAAAHPARVQYTTQGTLLEALGIGQRAARLAQGLSGAALSTHVAAYERLTHPSQMGTLFKALAITNGKAPLCPGFPVPCAESYPNA